MNYNDFKELLNLCKKLGIETVAELDGTAKLYNAKTNSDILVLLRDLAENHD